MNVGVSVVTLPGKWWLMIWIKTLVFGLNVRCTMIKSIINGGAIYFRVKVNTSEGHLAVVPKGNSLLLSKKYVGKIVRVYPWGYIYIYLVYIYEGP